jgi:hypothetical protein
MAAGINILITLCEVYNLWSTSLNTFLSSSTHIPGTLFSNICNLRHVQFSYNVREIKIHVRMKKYSFCLSQDFELFYFARTKVRYPYWTAASTTNILTGLQPALHVFGQPDFFMNVTCSYVINTTNMIHFTFAIALLRFKVSTCFGHYLPIIRRLHECSFGDCCVQ